MSVLSDRGIAEQMTRGQTLVWRMLNKARQPASVDVRLGSTIGIYRTDLTDHVIDLREPQDMAWEAVTLTEDGHLLPPGGFALGVLRERIAVPNDLCGFVVGRSGVARIGLCVESAGLLDHGYAGCPTLELHNQSPHPIRLFDAMPIAQVYFVKLDQPAEVPYGNPIRTSKYQGDTSPIPSRLHLESARSSAAADARKGEQT